MRMDEEPPRAAWNWPVARERCLREAQRYTRCPVQAEDVVQEALLRAWKTRSSLRNPAQPMPWLLQITRNEALRSLARTARDRDHAVLMPDPEPPPASAEWTEAAALRIDVAAAMRHLHPHERAMMTMRYTEELTHSTIAARMKIPVGTCKVRLHRLRKRLSALLVEEVPA